jgi:hypothetical protein
MVSQASTNRATSPHLAPGLTKGGLMLPVNDIGVGANSNTPTILILHKLDISN